MTTMMRILAMAAMVAATALFAACDDGSELDGEGNEVVGSLTRREGVTAYAEAACGHFWETCERNAGARAACVSQAVVVGCDGEDCDALMPAEQQAQLEACLDAIPQYACTEYDANGQSVPEVCRGLW